jgi:hypothetical protein
VGLARWVDPWQLGGVDLSVVKSFWVKEKDERCCITEHERSVKMTRVGRESGKVM